MSSGVVKRIDRLLRVDGIRDPGLDFIRCVAILMVFFTHLDHYLSRGGNPTSIQVLPTLMASVISYGSFGVRLFFSLSGFLVGGNLLTQAMTTGISFKTFYWRRILRILPASWFFLILMTLIATPGELYHFDMYFFANIFYYTNYLGHAWQAHYWTLNVEEHFYLFFPWLACFSSFLAKRIHRYLFYVSLGSISLLIYLIRIVSWTGQEVVYFSGDYQQSHFFIDYFLIGAVLGYYSKSESGRRFLSKISILIPLVFCFICAKFLGYESFLPNDFLKLRDVGQIGALIETQLSLLFGVLVFLFSGRLTVISKFPVIRWLASLSYSLYLWHLKTMDYLLPFDHFLPKTQVPIITYLLHGSFFFGGAIIVSLASFTLIERPFLKLRSKMT